jgi:hypothetical protein
MLEKKAVRYATLQIKYEKMPVELEKVKNAAMDSIYEKLTYEMPMK